MIRRKTLGVLLLTLFLAVSCNRSDDSSETQTVENQINTFVWKGLSSWYYWQKDVPNLADSFAKTSQYKTLMSSKNPDEYFIAY